MESHEITKKIWPQPVNHSGTAKKIETLRNASELFLETLNDLTPTSREQNLAITKFEEVVMWGVKAITHNQ
jgi:hypothetical protein